jgi:hypothetical protein
MSALSADQISALEIRATLTVSPFPDSFEQGMRDAQAALATVLRLHSDDQAALLRNLRAYRAEGPAWDSQDYLDGGEDVHFDVDSILTGDRAVIAELLAMAAYTTSTTGGN